MKKYRVYADTSVFGGCFDDEFSNESLKFFSLVREGIFSLIISPVLYAELLKAPIEVQNLFKTIPTDLIEEIEFSDEIITLRDEYLKSGILTMKSKSDAEHIASATIANADFVVSWNFKHIVHFDKINGYQAVNILNGYKPINIYAPFQVI